jgi:acyl-CoA reductase-like NAD-dependent aldehyde dehydrogenase
MTDRLTVRKTYKLWIGGAFVRSESGRYDTAGIDGRINIPRASRKDVRDAVTAARAAAGPWAARTAYNRGQILYRAAEALESRSAAPAQSRGATSGDGPDRDQLEASVDVLVHHAGWTDKFQSVLGGINPVAAPFLSFSVPEPTGVVGIVAPDEPDLLGLVAELAPALAAGNTAVVVLSETRPLAGLDLAEALGVADIPPGVINLLSGRRSELAGGLGAHRDVNAIVDAAGDSELSAELGRLGAETIKRVRRRPAATNYDEAVGDSLGRIEALTELKTAWHPVGT